LVSRLFKKRKRKFIFDKLFKLKKITKKHFLNKIRNKRFLKIVSKRPMNLTLIKVQNSIKATRINKIRRKFLRCYLHFFGRSEFLGDAIKLKQRIIQKNQWLGCSLNVNIN
jgi:hypothetical protein